MTEKQAVTTANKLDEYVASVDDLHNLLSGESIDESTIEQLFLKIITLREAVNESLQEKSEYQLDTTTLHKVANIDEKLYHTVQLMRRKTKINPAKWQYILPEPENAGWWWRLHQVPVWMNDKIEYENRFSVALIPAMILIIVALGVVAFSTQQLWASGEQWLGNISLLIQVLVGVGLVSANGREIATRLLHQFVNLFDDLLTQSSNNNPSPFPLAKHRTNVSLGILGASILFFTVVFIFTVIVIPAAARWFHEMGVNAVEERNVSRAEFYLELAVAVQPDLVIVPFSFSGAPSFAQLGNLYREIGNLSAAREAYENALGEDARAVNVHYRLAEIYIAEGDLDAAFAVLDRALTLLAQHTADEIRLPLGSDRLDSENEAQQLTYLTLITRAEAFLELDDVRYRTALRDLDNARLVVHSNPNLFITRENLGENRSETILTTKLHVLYARSLTLLIGDACIPDVLDEWRLVRRLSRFARTSNEQLWLDEANVAIEECR